jgi:hypothetical protein
LKSIFVIMPNSITTMATSTPTIYDIHSAYLYLQPGADQGP